MRIDFRKKTQSFKIGENLFVILIFFGELLAQLKKIDHICTITI